MTWVTGSLRVVAVVLVQKSRSPGVRASNSSLPKLVAVGVRWSWVFLPTHWHISSDWRGTSCSP